MIEKVERAFEGMPALRRAILVVSLLNMAVDMTGNEVGRYPIYNGQLCFVLVVKFKITRNGKQIENGHTT